MATFRKRGDYQWQAEIRRKGWPYQTKTFESRADAEKWARDVEGAMDKGAFVSRAEAERTTVADWLDTYEKDFTEAKKGKDKEKSVIATLKASKLGPRMMSTITPADVATLRDDWLKEGYSPATVNRRFNVLSHVFSAAKTEGGMMSLSNPVEHVRRPKSPQGRDRRLKLGEFERLLSAAAESKELGAIITLAVETAMRRGEMVSLRRVNVNLKNRTLALEDTKNGESRVVPLSSRAVALLESLPTRIDGKIFGLAPDSITQAFDRACQRARKTYEQECKEAEVKPESGYLEDLRFHDLRHEAASRLFEKGLHPMEVASVTGHKTLQMLKRYTHLRAEELAKKLG